MITKDDVIKFIQEIPNDKFDFEIWNAVSNKARGGLKLALIEGMLKNLIRDFEYYRNPMSKELFGIGEELIEFRLRYKQNAARRAQNDSSIRNSNLDNQTDLKNPSTSADAGAVATI